MIVLEYGETDLDVLDAASHYRSSAVPYPVESIVTRDYCPSCGRTARIVTETGRFATFVQAHVLDGCFSD